MFMELHHNDLKTSDNYLVGDRNLGESPAVTALRAFLHDAKAESLPRPRLQDVDSNNELEIEVSSVSGPLHLKPASQVYACGPDVIKHVASQAAYDRELVALREIGRHPSLISLRAFSISATDRWLRLSPRGECSLASFPDVNATFREAAVAQVLSAAKWIHDHDFIHRDIRPDNIVVLSDGKCILIDLGHAVKGKSFQDSHFIGVRLFAAHKHLKESSSQYTWDPITDLESIAKTFDFTTRAKGDQFQALRDLDVFAWERTSLMGTGCWYQNFHVNTNLGLGYDELSTKIKDFFRI